MNIPLKEQFERLESRHGVAVEALKRIQFLHHYDGSLTAVQAVEARNIARKALDTLGVVYDEYVAEDDNNIQIMRNRG